MAESGRKPYHKYLDQFHQDVHDVDETAQAILKGHLILEGALDNIMDTIFFHGKYLRDARLTFHTKVQLVRAYSSNSHEVPSWELLRAVNSLRNEIAHRVKGEQRDRKVFELRKLYLSGCTPEDAAIDGQCDDSQIVHLACAQCAGLLSSVEVDAEKMRHIINESVAKYGNVQDASRDA